MNRALLSSLLVVAVAGCGGNWSNSDLVFANALPRTEDLRSNIPSESTAQPLTGVGTRRDGLMVGDPSVSWSLTKGAAKDFNGIVLALLGIVDQVRKVPPTSRTSSSRTWGPFNDTNNPGRELQVVITRVDEQNFAWQVQSRPTNGEFVTVIDGSFLANTSSTARIGRGSIVVPVKDFRDVVKLDDNLKVLDKITIAYVTDLWPKRVDIDFEVTPGVTTGLSALGYTAQLREDSSGSMRFLFAQSKPEAEEIEITTGWKPTGEGRGFGIVRKGTWLGYNVTECWSRGFKISYYAESWPGGQTIGNLADCVTLEGF